VQPAEPLDVWTSPAFEPTLCEGKLLGRGTDDDKGQAHIHLKAPESLQKVNGKIPINIKVLIGGKEEVGNVSLLGLRSEKQRQTERRRTGSLRDFHARQKRALRSAWTDSN